MVQYDLECSSHAIGKKSSRKENNEGILENAVLSYIKMCENDKVLLAIVLIISIIRSATCPEGDICVHLSTIAHDPLNFLWGIVFQTFSFIFSASLLLMCMPPMKYVIVPILIAATILAYFF